MCGIVGIFDLRGFRDPDKDLLARMNASQRHRGPDADGLFVAPGVGLGHRRLAIIDLEGGNQPFFNEDGSVAVVFNGEIYNFQELALELESLGHVFRSRSDTEVLVHGWEAWGEACVDRLQGMFAFALWDKNAASLFLARDRLGIKPLYFSFLPNGWLAFASELKGIMVHPAFNRTLDPRGVECYFALGYVPDPLTIYQGAEKLPPGHMLTLRHNQWAVPCAYWDLTFEPGPHLSETDAAAELIHRLEATVRGHLIADVPLAAFLSGGVDSSAVAAMMARASTDTITACTVSFGDSRFNETPFAAQVAARFHLRHEVEQADPDHFSQLDDLAFHHDEPFADNSALPTWIVCQMARKQVKVVLSGDGGDESLAGYERYRFFMAEEKIRALFPLWFRRGFFGTLGRIYPKADRLPRMFRAKSTFQALAQEATDGYFRGVSLTDWGLRARLFAPDFIKELQGYRADEIFRKLAVNAPAHPLSKVQYLDFKTFLAGRVLTKVDRASMAHGLEVRVPLLDHKLVEWMAGLPPSFKLKNGVGKYIFKKGLEPLLPESVLYRRKMGFIIPVADWLRGPLRERLRQTILGGRLAETGLFVSRALAHIEEKHASGAYDYSGPLWALLMFDAFLKTGEIRQTINTDGPRIHSTQTL